MSTVTVLRLILETLSTHLHRAVQAVCEANMGALAEVGELLRVMHLVSHALMGAEHEAEGDTAARRRRLIRLRDRIQDRRERNEHTVGNGPDAAYLANARIKTDDMALDMIADALKGL